MELNGYHRGIYGNYHIPGNQGPEIRRIENSFLPATKCCTAEIDGEALIVETANPSNVIARISVLNCPGRTFGGNDYDTGERIQEAYAVAGKGLGKFIKDKTR